MHIEHDVRLQPLNTFGIAVTARYFARAGSTGDIREALNWGKRHEVPVIILGGGSNILFTDNVDSLVLHVATKGIEVSKQENGKRLVSVAAGENWADLVWWAAARGYGGIENLSMIPGTAGAAPVQNIGAYGTEFCDICDNVTALDRQTGELRVFSRQECRFGYRDSLFKQQAEKWVVINIDILLDKFVPLRTGYGNLEEKLALLETKQPCFTDVAKAVAAIRQAKLPSPEELGSAGSFFKNPVVPAALYQELCEKYPGIPGFEQPGGAVKLSAAWLLDAAGWKGKRAADVGCHTLQPLVLVNHGAATGKEILAFSQTIQADIARRFGVNLEREAVVYP